MKKKYLLFITVLTLVFSSSNPSGGGDSSKGGTTPQDPIAGKRISEIYVPAGTFKLGASNPDMTISKGYWMAETEVTQELWEAVMGNNPSSFTSGADDGEVQEKRPVERVTWYDAIEFCNKLSVLDGKTPFYTIDGRTPLTGYPITSATVGVTDWNGKGYRLPTEMEWMWAAMGARDTSTGYGKAFAGSTGTNSIGNYAWYSSNSSSKTHEVKKKLPNELGLYDMSGNVWEWCWDWDGAYPGAGATDYTGPGSGSNRVARGSSWLDNAGYCAVASKSFPAPDYRYGSLGFRFMRTAD